MTVTGIIDHIKAERDGDLQIRVHPDPQYNALIQQMIEYKLVI
jgi:hypothetical protein